MGDDFVQSVVREVIKKLTDGIFVPVGVSNRHVHLSQEVVERLFGQGHSLTKLKDLKQPGQFAAVETVTLKGPKGIIEKVRVLGPARKESQIEVSLSDSRALGIRTEVRESGHLDGTSSIELTGPSGSILLPKGVIAAFRHIHMPHSIAIKKELVDGQMVHVKTLGNRSLTFHQVLVRVSDAYELEMHLDVEEANASGISNGDVLEIIK